MTSWSWSTVLSQWPRCVCVTFRLTFTHSDHILYAQYKHNTHTHSLTLILTYTHMRTQSITLALAFAAVALSGCASNSNRPKPGTELMDQLPPHVWGYACKNRPRCVRVPVVVIGEDQHHLKGQRGRRDWPRTGVDLSASEPWHYPTNDIAQLTELGNCCWISWIPNTLLEFLDWLEKKLRIACDISPQRLTWTQQHDQRRMCFRNAWKIFTNSS